MRAPAAAKLFGVEHLRTVATADLNTTVGMWTLGVFLLSSGWGVTHKGFVVFAGEWFTLRSMLIAWCSDLAGADQFCNFE